MSSNIQSVAYEDFLQEFHSSGINKESTKKQNGKRHDSSLKCLKNENISTAIKLCSDSGIGTKQNTDGKSMSYTEFLNLFKSSSPNISTTEVECSDVTLTETGSPNKIVKCKSITSYFTKSEVKTKSSSVETAKVIVTAQIHNSPPALNQELISSPPRPKILQNSLNLNKDADSIVLLSTETIEGIEEKRKSTKLSIKKRKHVENPLQEGELKKPKVEHVTGSRVKQADHLNDSNNSDSSFGLKCSQATLCFGKNGFSLIKSDVKKCGDEQDKKHSTSSSNVDDKYMTLAKSISRNSVLNDTCAAVQQNSKDEKTTSKPNIQKEPEVSIVEIINGSEGKDVEMSPVETHSLRRSSRIRNPPKILEESVIEVDEDSDDCENKTKRNNKKFETAQKTNLKPNGTLAPIFTHVKTKGADVKKCQPVEDPETVRLRKEFLMSGIPDELKKQITSAATSTVSCDYPPWPLVTHVQQLQTSSCAPQPSRKFQLKCAESEGVEICLQQEHFVWKTIALDTNAPLILFESFSCHPCVPDETINKLLQSFQLADNSLKFDKIYRHWQSNLGQGDKLTASEENICKQAKLSEEIIVIDETPPRTSKPETKIALEAKECLWTDLHQPSVTEHVLGNSSTIKQLKCWLEKWKASLQKENSSKSSKPVMKNKKNSTWSDDSDFTDSDEEEIKLCNTMLVTGCHGSGKTSTVYALANELGFKVFEVNSSSLRSGKQLLSQLEEATQSHKVAQKKTCVQALEDSPISIENSNEKVSKKANLRTQVKSAVRPLNSVVNFLKSNVTTCKKTDKQKGSNNKGSQARQTVKDQAKKSTAHVESEQNAVSGHVNLATVSLILFDEVDVVFEEDKGFLSTLQYFMSSTKIPIILTCTDRRFYLQLSQHHERVMFKKPSKVSIARYLSTVCLIHGMCIDQETATMLVRHLRGDIRSCLLSLQYWCESGGGRVQKDAGSNNFDTTPQTESRLPSKRRNNVLDDDDADSSPSIALHKECTETMLSLPLGDHLSLQSVLNLLKVPLTSTVDFDVALHAFSVNNQFFRTNTIYQVALHGLPLPKAEPVTVDMTASVRRAASGQIRKKRILQSWFDSDSSDSSKSCSNILERDSCDQIKEAGNDCNQSKCPTAEAESGEMQLNMAVLSEMARFYDYMSFVDCTEKFCCIEDCGTSPGLIDKDVFSPQVNPADWLQPLGCTVSLLAARNLCCKIDKSMELWKQSQSESVCSEMDSLTSENFGEEFCLPLGDLSPELIDNSHCENSCKKFVTRNILNNLGFVIVDSNKKLYTDYLPFLREMCRTENDRHIAKSQRRFQHYFSSIGLNLDQSTVDCLSL